MLAMRHLHLHDLLDKSRSTPARKLDAKETLAIIDMSADQRFPDPSSLARSLQEKADAVHAELHALRSRKFPSDIAVDAARKTAVRSNADLADRRRDAREAKEAFDRHHLRFWGRIARTIGIPDRKASSLAASLEVATGAKNDAERAFDDAEEHLYDAIDHRNSVRKEEAGDILSRIDDLDDARDALLRGRDAVSNLEPSTLTLSAAIDLGRSKAELPPLREEARTRSRSQRRSSSSPLPTHTSSTGSLATGLAIGIALSSSFSSD